jgi:hypothetical protein
MMHQSGPGSSNARLCGISLQRSVLSAHAPMRIAKSVLQGLERIPRRGDIRKETWSEMHMSPHLLTT